MKWSKLKKQVKNRFAESVKDRVDFHTTVYTAGPYYGYPKSWITIDGIEIIDMALTNYNAYYNSFVDGVVFGPEEGVIEDRLNKNYFDITDFNKLLSESLNFSIENIIQSPHPMVRAFGMLDKRLGKRKLRKMDVKKENEIVQRMFFLRCSAEGLMNIADSVLHESIQKVKNESLKITSNKKKEELQKTLESSKETREIKKILNHALEHKLDIDAFKTDLSKELYASIERVEYKDDYVAYLLAIEDKTKLLTVSDYVIGLESLFNMKTNWIRDMSDYYPGSHNLDRQFSALARHLLAKFSVPIFMDKAWLQKDDIQQEWFIHIAQGYNIRTVTTLPVKMTKKYAHYFLSAPDHYTINDAIWLGSILTLGGNFKLANAIRGTRIRNVFNDQIFWESVLRFFIRNPMLDHVHIGPIIDYIWSRKYEVQMEFIEDGIAVNRGAIQPDFSMRGRNVESLLRAVRDWHVQLGREIKSGDKVWEPSGLKEFNYVEGTKEAKNMCVWHIRELLNSRQLVAEGRQMRHCVSSYSGSCSERKSAIWSMYSEQKSGIEKHLTIEVNLTEMEIQQVRGKNNRYADQREKDILRRWSEANNIKIADYSFED